MAQTKEKQIALVSTSDPVPQLKWDIFVEWRKKGRWRQVFLLFRAYYFNFKIRNAVLIVCFHLIIDSGIANIILLSKEYYRKRALQTKET